MKQLYAKIMEDNSRMKQEMEEIKQVNVQIKEEIKMTKKQVKLQALKINQTDPSIGVMSITREIQTDSMQLEISAVENDYKLCFPARKIKYPNLTVDCKGCGAIFKASIQGYDQWPYPEIAYYIHCMNECEAYQKLSLIFKCEDCKLLFISSRSFSNHIARGHQSGSKQYRCIEIPASEQILKLIPTMKNKSKQQIMTESNYGHLNTTIVCSCNGFVKCRGCQLEFRAKIEPDHRKVFTLDYYVHCMEECEEYRKLGLISECSKCKLKFLNKQSLATHKGKCNRKQ